MKVRGDQLVARDGAYDLRVTAELWETHFFDRLALGYVDHPAGTEVFVDERFAVPAPPLDLVATDPVRPFASVRDDRGQDVAGVVAARDDRHLDFAGRGAYQGITRDHFVELELPDDAPRDGPLWLDRTRLGAPDRQLGERRDLAGRACRAAGAVAARGGRLRPVPPGARRAWAFRQARTRPCGSIWPASSPATGPRRLRLSTNLEVFWDRLGWAAGRRDVRPRLVLLPLVAADLRYRGYSVTEQRDASTPERPRYRLAGTTPRWPDLEGYHTRFGDVRALVTATDDRYAIMNAGDELALRFALAPPVPPGMVRDFVVIGDGWVKDGDFNTTFSRTVLPLPTHASSRYDRAPSTLEADPVYQRHRADFEQYHTRYVWPRVAERPVN